MSDLLSPILVVMENEVDAFWCFVSLMDEMVMSSCLSIKHVSVPALVHARTLNGVTEIKAAFKIRFIMSYSTKTLRNRCRE